MNKNDNNWVIEILDLIKEDICAASKRYSVFMKDNCKFSTQLELTIVGILKKVVPFTFEIFLLPKLHGVSEKEFNIIKKIIIDKINEIDYQSIYGS